MFKCPDHQRAVDRLAYLRKEIKRMEKKLDQFREPARQKTKGKSRSRKSPKANRLATARTRKANRLAKAKARKASRLAQATTEKQRSRILIEETRIENRIREEETQIENNIRAGKG